MRLSLLSVQKSSFNLATLLTISRFFFVPVFIYFFLMEDFEHAVIILIIASVTDVLDGFLARKMNMGTKLGSILDPLADKFLMTVSFIVLSFKDAIPWWCTAIVIGRDLCIVFGLIYLYYLRRINIVIQPSRLSKRTTFSQFCLLTFSFLGFFLHHNSFDISETSVSLILNLQKALVYIATLLTVATFLQYTQKGLELIKTGQRR